MSIFKFISVFLLTILFITETEFQPIRANQFKPPQLMVTQAEKQGLASREEIYYLYQQGEYQTVIEILSNYQREDLSPFEEYLAASYENTGHVSLAVQHWYRALKTYETMGNYPRAGYCLLKLAQGYLDLGRASEAISLIQNWPYPLPVFADGVLGNAYLVTGKYKQAHREADPCGIASYQQVLNNQLSTQQRLTALNNLGSSYEKLALKSQKLAKFVKQKQERENIFETAQKASINARKTREKAWIIAQNHSYPSAIKAKLNWLKYTNNTEIIEVAAQDIQQLPTNHRKIKLLISLAKVSQQPEKTLQTALQLAEDIEDLLSLAIASAELGKLYEQQQRYDLALSYTEAAEQYIYPLLFYEYLYQYQWQEARIYEGLNQPEKAKSAYRRSLESLQKIREQVAFSSKETEFDFQESIEPIYRGLLTLLLKDRPSSSDLKQSLQVFEQFQLAQLENLFADVCFEGETKDITSRLQEEKIAIITPIILEQYIHIIALTPEGKYYHHAEEISSKEINQKIAQWRLDLEDIRNEQYLSNSTFFYNIIFKPFEEIMAKIHPSSIVFINDGLLRNVPMAALYDPENKQFLHNFMEKQELQSLPLPPGSFGLPLMGETIPFLKNINKFPEQRFQKYGNIFKTKIFGQPFLYIKGAQANRYFLTSKNLETNFPSSVQKLLGDSAVSNQKGDIHKSRRQIIAQSFKPRNLDQYMEF